MNAGRANRRRRLRKSDLLHFIAAIPAAPLPKPTPPTLTARASSQI